MSNRAKPKPNKWIVAGVLFFLALFMYLSIIFKIFKFGP